jgi:thioesterase domain-containing protein
VAALFRADTIARLAELLRAGSGAAGRSVLVDLTPQNRRAVAGSAPRVGRAPRPRPFFCVHPAGGNVLCYAELARALGPEQPFYGLQLPDLAALGPAPTIESLAARYVEAVLAVPGASPHRLGGWSLGGVIAYEMVRQLRAAGHHVAPPVLIDPTPLVRPAAPARPAALQELGAAPAVAAAEAGETGEAAADDADADAAEAMLRLGFLHDLLSIAGRPPALSLAELRRADPDLGLPRLLAAARLAGLPPELDDQEVERLLGLYRVTRRALDRYRPGPGAGRLIVLLAGRSPAPAAPRTAARAGSAPIRGLPWTALAAAGSEVELLPGDHYSIVARPAVAVLAAALRRRLAVAAEDEPRREPAAAPAVCQSPSAREPAAAAARVVAVAGAVASEG